MFIVGTERSGSNLLRVILNAHPAISIPHPPHILAFFAPLEKYYGDLSRERNFRKLLADVVRHVNRHIHPWPMSINVERLYATARPRDAFGLFAAIYDQYLEFTGKRRWGCKSTFMIHYVDRILARYPEAQIIWLVRDPRSVALSSRSSVFNPFHPYYVAQLWALQQKLALQLQATLSPANFTAVRYEDLITDPVKVVQSICTFLHEDFDPAMLDFYQTDDAHMSAALSRDWKNTASPILSNNGDKFLSRMSENEVALIESVAGDTMRKLGYRILLNREMEPPGPLRRLYYATSNQCLRIPVEYHSWREDRNQWRRWARRARIGSLRIRLQFGLR
jgi:sulfotransferase family protein